MDIVNSNFTTIIPSNSTIDLFRPAGVELSFAFQFWFSLCFHVPSLFGYAMVLAHILAKKSQRQALHNHSIIVLLVISLFVVLLDYSWTLDSVRRGEVWPQTPAFCQVWWFLDYGFFNACTVVLAWSSIERYILIFHSNLTNTKRRIILIHYCPLISILIYLTIFYIYAIFFPPCENEYDFTSPACGAYPCYLSIQWLSLWDIIAHGIIATFLIAIFNVVLFVAILRQKYRRHPNWRRYRKMAFQLLSISALYLSLNLPLAITFLVQLSGHPEWGVRAQQYLYYFTALLQYLLPFACLPYLSGSWQKIKKFFARNNRRIASIPMLVLKTPHAQQQ